MSDEHREAFCHMQYASDDGRIVRSIWNSRDGVTPFGCRDPYNRGVELKHVNWNQDRRDPDHIPEVGDWIWVDLQPERALQMAEAQVEQFWDHPGYPMSDRFGSKAEAARVLMEGYYDGGGVLDDNGEPIKLRPPDLVQVTGPMRDEFAARAKAVA